HKQTSSMSRGSRSADAAPGPGECLDVSTRTPAERETLSNLARRLTVGLEPPRDVAEALFRFVDQEIANEPSIGGPAASAADCLTNKSGDCGAKSRLLAVLLRHRGMPARLVTGLTLTKGTEQLAHYWVEAWIDEHWLPMC